MTIPRVGEVPGDYFSGGARLTTGELAAVIATAADKDSVRNHHASIVTASTYKSTTGKEPTAVDNGAALFLAFTPNTDAAWRQFKIPHYYDSNPSLHIHWSKTSDANEVGKAVKWRVTYRVFNGSSQDAAAVDQVIDCEDTYDDAGTTTRIVHRTPDLPLVGFVAGYYIAIRIEAVTPLGAALASEPGVWSADLMFSERINQ